MQLKNFSLSIKKMCLLKNVNIKFIDGEVNHILGKNGTGKSSFAKAILGVLKYEGVIENNKNCVCVIGSYTNIPLELTTKDIIKVIRKKFGNTIIDDFGNNLGLPNIPFNNSLKDLSDGQRQKIKLLFFLASDPSFIVLDEFTNALDKKSCMEIYEFINNYIHEKNITVLNITHNLTDLEYLNGNFYLIKGKNIICIPTKEEVIDYYIKGD